MADAEECVISMCGVNDVLKHTVCSNGHKVHTKCFKNMARAYLRQKGKLITIDCPRCKEEIFFGDVFVLLRKMYKRVQKIYDNQRKIAKRRRTAIKEIARAFEHPESSEGEDDFDDEEAGYIF